MSVVNLNRLSEELYGDVGNWRELMDANNVVPFLTELIPDTVPLDTNRVDELIQKLPTRDEVESLVRDAIRDATGKIEEKLSDVIDQINWLF